MRGLWSNLALLVVLIGLGAYIYLVTWKQPAGGAATKQEKLFEAVSTDGVEELKVKSESGDVTSLKKNGTDWQVTSPIATRASDAEVAGITTALAGMEIARVVDENPADVKEFGLDPPRIDIEFKLAGGKPGGRLLVGEKTATGTNLYARRNDEKRVLLIPSFQEAALNKSTFDLRDKKLLTFQRDKIDGIEVTRDGKTMQFAKEGSEWKLTKPIAARADYSAVEGLVGRVESAQMKSIVAAEATPADLKKYGLDKPAVTVNLGLGSARATLAVGGKAGDTAVYARDTSKPTVVTVESALADDLKKSVDDYRRKDVFEFRAFNATRVEFTRDGKTVAFERVKSEGENAPDKWKRVAPTAADAEKEKIETLLTGLADMRVTTFADSTAKTGLAQPALVVVAKFDEGKKEERVSFGKNGDEIYVSRPGDPGAGKIEAERFAEALKTLDELAK